MFFPVLIIGIVFLLLSLPRLVPEKGLESTDDLYLFSFLITMLFLPIFIETSPLLVIILPTLGIPIFLFMSRLICAVIWELVRAIFKDQNKIGFNPKDTTAAILISGGLGISLASVSIGISTFLSQFGQPHFEIFEHFFVLIVTITPVTIISYHLIKLILKKVHYLKIINQYRTSEPYLIKP